MDWIGLFQTLFGGMLARRRDQTLTALALAEYRAARGAAHLVELKIAVEGLRKELHECHAMLSERQQSVDRLEREQRDALSQAAQRYAVQAHLREVDGVTPELRDHLLEKVFKSGLSDLERIPDSAGVSPELQRRISVWVSRYLAWLPVLVNQPFPGKDELLSDFDARRAALQREIDAIIDRSQEINATLQRVQEEIECLSRVSPDDLAAVRRGEQPSDPRVEHYLRGVYAEWERPPDWYRLAVENEEKG